VQSSLPGRVQLLVDGADMLYTGDSKDYAVTVGAAGWLRVVLTWYDSAGAVLVNDLSLSVLAPDSSTVYPAAGAVEDHINNVRVASLGGLPPGPYTLRVTGYNVPDSPQGFALAVTA
jgi:hypothetical protein